MKFIRESIKDIINREVHKSLQEGQMRICKVELSNAEWADFTKEMSPEMARRKSYKMAFTNGSIMDLALSSFGPTEMDVTYHEVEVVRVDRVGGF